MLFAIRHGLIGHHLYHQFPDRAASAGGKRRRRGDDISRQQTQRLAPVHHHCNNGYVPIVIVIAFLFINGLQAISWEFLTQPPSNGMTEGSIMPTIFGTILLSLKRRLSPSRLVRRDDFPSPICQTRDSPVLFVSPFQPGQDCLNRLQLFGLGIFVLFLRTAPQSLLANDSRLDDTSRRNQHLGRSDLGRTAGISPGELEFGGHPLADRPQPGHAASATRDHHRSHSRRGVP